MSKVIEFKKGERLIKQGESGVTAYLIYSGWVQIDQRRKNGTVFQTRLGPGEIVGELALAGLIEERTATATALTLVAAEEIDRGSLIRLVNGPGSKLAPLLAALLSRLKSTMIEEKRREAEEPPVRAIITGLNSPASQALCNLPCNITHLPWTFGSHVAPQSVTDLFRNQEKADIRLGNASKRIREQHIRIEADSDSGLQLQLLQHGDYCEVDEKRVGYGTTSTTVPLKKGHHVICFGDQIDPYKFGIEVLD